MRKIQFTETVLRDANQSLIATRLPYEKFESILETMDNSKALLYAYDRLVEGIEAHQEKIDISHRTYTIDWDEAATIQELVLMDHPEFFYISYTSFGGGKYVTYFAPNYWAEMEAYIGLVNHRVEVLTRGLEGKSDYEKSVILHDRVCDAVTYNLNSNYLHL